MNALEFLNDIGDTNFVKIDTLNNPVQIMERYANYKTRDFQEKILGFRQKLKNVDTSIEGTICIWNEDDALIKLESYYDNFFNITAVRNGTI